MLFRLSSLHGRAIRRDRHQDRLQRQLPRLEGLEERCLLSGISGITEFTLPSSTQAALSGITTGPDGNLWFTDRGRQRDRDDQPDHARDLFVHNSHRRMLALWNRGGFRRQSLVHRNIR